MSLIHLLVSQNWHESTLLKHHMMHPRSTKYPWQSIPKKKIGRFNILDHDYMSLLGRWAEALRTWVQWYQKTDVCNTPTSYLPGWVRGNGSDAICPSSPAYLVFNVFGLLAIIKRYMGFFLCQPWLGIRYVRRSDRGNVGSNKCI